MRMGCQGRGSLGDPRIRLTTLLCDPWRRCDRRIRKGAKTENPTSFAHEHGFGWAGSDVVRVIRLAFGGIAKDVTLPSLVFVQ